MGRGQPSPSTTASKRRSHGEGALYFDDTRRRWVGQAWIDGRRRKVSARTKADAAAKLGQLRHGDDADRHADRRLTVGTLLADWQQRALPGRDLAPTTIEVHSWAAHLLTTELGKVRLADLDVTTVERALDRLARGSQGAPLAKASLVKIRSTLRQALAWAQRRRAIGHNPAAVAELPTTDPGRRRRALTGAELDRLLGALDGHPLAAMFLVMARVGLRPGEAAGLCVDAIDLDAGTVTVTRAVQLKRGRPSLVEALKTTGSRRTVALPASAVTALRNHLAGSGITAGLVFPGPDGQPLWPSTVRAELADASRAAGLAPVRPNELRHTAATRLADAGLPPHQVADILGHRSTRMVDAVYRHRPAVVHGADLPGW